MPTISRMYDSYAEAVSVVHALEAERLPDHHISLVAQENARGRTAEAERRVADTDATTTTPKAAVAGGLVGGAIGLLTGLGVMAIPGVGPLVAAGWLATTLAGAGVGAAAGGLVGALVDSGVSREEAEVYEEGIRRGNTLVTVRVPDGADTARVERLMDRPSSIGWQNRRQEYEAAGWTANQVTSGVRRGDPRVSGASHHRLVAADKVEGTKIYNPSGDNLGSVEDMMIDKISGRVAYAVIGFGGLLGIGSRHYPLPWEKLKYDTDMGGYVVDLDKRMLEGAPSYGDDEAVGWDDRAWGKQVNDYYGTRPYWDAP
jgi:uncharacterized membrane protein/sporulation protein YlmC with PRC-barrel domain